MNFLLHHIKHISSVYKGAEPLNNFLKKYFKQHPSLGSRDRKAITEAVFLYYRFASFYPPQTGALPVIQSGIIKINSENSFLEKVFSEQNIPAATPEGFSFDNAALNIELSEGIDEKSWLSAIMQQAKVFLRKSNHQPIDIVQTLKEKGLQIELLPLDKVSQDIAISLPATTKIQQILDEKNYVVQDYASQKAMAKALEFRNENIKQQKVWDVCCGAGGKSLFWKYRYPNDFILATDIRKSILFNFEKRFNLYGLHLWETKLIDAAKENNVLSMHENYDTIICDVPCSGSGTWNRSPEQFHFFDKNKLKQYADLQFAITANASTKLKNNGVLFYITCSVFKEENEFIVERLQKETKLNLMHRALINEISHNANALFLAVFKK